MFMRTSLLTAAALVATASSAALALVPTSMSSNQPYGMRGQTVPFTARLTSGGCPVPNRPVFFYDRSDRRPYLTFQGIGCTNGAGQVTLWYHIPTNVMEDNVYLHARFLGDQSLGCSETVKRVQIGHPYP